MVLILVVIMVLILVVIVKGKENRNEYNPFLLYGAGVHNGLKKNRTE